MKTIHGPPTIGVILKIGQVGMDGVTGKRAEVSFMRCRAGHRHEVVV
jgi:hypothetical protein